MSGYCTRSEGCVCGGDTQEVREHCSNWVNAPEPDARLEACNFCLAQATEARAETARIRHDIQSIITKFQAGHLGYIGFVEAIASLPYFKKDQA